MKVLFIFAVLLLFIFSCNSKQEHKETNNIEKVTITDDIKANYKQVSYYSNGQIKYVQEYFNGIKHGIYKNWYENGSIRTMGLYNLGFRKGQWYWYNEKGILEFQVNYDKQIANL